ncbi:MAG TPA: methyltransferase domain-containing protein [Blastocatellia bacterium]|nr:methyltransferase domain-containing protein [Blastocatellia bacterium]
MRTDISAQLRRSGIPNPDCERPLTDPFKQLAREQWGANPCGAHVADELDYGTREYFDAIEQNRYLIESPWMNDAIGFDRFSGKRLLEIGMGTGTDLLQFARGGAMVTGLDITPRSIEIARRRFQVYGLTGDFAIGDGESLSFPDASFDAVYSFGVLHHTPDTARAVREIHRVLTPGGKAIVMLYHRRSLYYWGSLMMKHGILRAELLNHSMAQIMSRHVEYSATEGRPLVKAYSQAEIREMFREFVECETRVNQLTRRDLRPLGRFVPEALLQRLARNFGWNVLITATK